MKRIFQKSCKNKMSVKDTVSDDSELVMIPPPHQSMSNEPEKHISEITNLLCSLQQSVGAVHADVKSMMQTVDRLTVTSGQLLHTTESLEEKMSRLSASDDVASEKTELSKHRLYFSAVVLVAAIIISLSKK